MSRHAEESEALLSSPTFSDTTSCGSPDSPFFPEPFAQPKGERSAPLCTPRRGIWLVFAIALLMVPGLIMTRLRDSGLESAPSLQAETSQSSPLSSPSLRHATDDLASPTDSASTNVTFTHDNVQAKQEEQKPSFSLLETLAPDGILDTLPPFPSSLLPEDPATAKYFAYLPHSGFHNQRDEFTNALTIAGILNRTLIVPRVRLGFPLGWQEKPELERRHEAEQRTHLAQPCAPLLADLEDPSSTRWIPYACKEYAKFTEMTWPLLVDLEALPEGTSLLPRNDMSIGWFTAPVSDGGLGLLPDDIHSVSDDTRYSWKIYDEASSETDLGKFEDRLDLQYFAEGPLSEKKLLYFGSLFGAERLSLSSPSALSLYEGYEKGLVFKNPLLDSLAIDIGHRLGGRHEYVGLHLRVGDGPFKDDAALNMKITWMDTCEGVFGLPLDVCLRLHADHSASDSPSDLSPKMRRSMGDRSSRNSAFWMTDAFEHSDFGNAQSGKALSRRSDTSSLEAFKTSDTLLFASSLHCPAALHEDPRLAPLNRPVYIATDAHSPREDPNLQVFFKSLPCAFILSDFTSTNRVNEKAIPDLINLFDVRVKLDGTRIAQFFIAFLEAEIASRSAIATIGTPGSTFSRFASHTLHWAYEASSS